jgi:hypothetical protein
VWEEMLTRELGAQAVTEFHGELIDGNQTVTVASEAFGRD